MTAGGHGVEGSRLAAGLVVLAVLLLVGCLGREQAKKQQKQHQQVGKLTLHKYFPNASGMDETITLFHSSGKPVHIVPIPALTSQHIQSISTYPVSDGLGLSIYLDPRGRMIWSQVTTDYYGQHMALVIDGQFRSLVKIPKSSGTGAFALDGPFTEEEAERLIAFVEQQNKDK